MGWLAFAPIPGPTTEYFGITTNQVDFFSVLFMLVGIPVGFVAIWCADIIGRHLCRWSFNKTNSRIILNRDIRGILIERPSDSHLKTLKASIITYKG